MAGAGGERINQVSVHPNLYPDAFKNDKDVDRDIFNGNTTSSVTDPKLNDKIVHLQGDWASQLDASRLLIEQHVEKRVSQVFMQAVACHQSDYTFREGHTFHQGFQAHKPFQAAHSATVPCLYATSKDSARAIVYLYRSGLYDESNATIDVLQAVNDADRAIDEKYTTSLLRKKTVTLLNKTARGEITPEQVSKEFVQALLDEIESALHNRKVTAKVKDVLKLYRERAEFLWFYVQHPKNFDMWLNLNMGDPMLGSLTTTIEKLKQNIPTSRGEILSLIKKKIAEIPPIILQEEHQFKNNTRVPNHFYHLYYHTILSRFHGANLAIVEEATGKQLQQLQTRVATFKNIGKTNLLLAQNIGKINQLVQEILPLIAHLQGQTIDKTQLAGLSAEKPKALRPEIYQLRFRMIRIDQEVQSAIKSKIEDILHQIKKTTNTKHVEAFFYHTLLNSAYAYMKPKLCKLLNISPAQLEQKIKELQVNETAHTTLERNACEISRIQKKVHKAIRRPTLARKRKLKNRISRVYHHIKSQRITINHLHVLFYKRLYDQAEKQADKQLLTELLPMNEQQVDRSISAHAKDKPAEQHIKNHQTLIKEIIKLSSEQIAYLNNETNEFRSDLMRTIRNSHGMSQKYFQELYKEKYPGFFMSDGTMDNLEHSNKRIDRTIARQLSEIFGVSASLFNPSHFAS